MNKIFIIILLWSTNLFAQVGINTPDPNSTLAVNGSLSANYREVTSTNYVIKSDDHYITYLGSANSTFTLPEIASGNSSFSGRIYRIKNLSGFSMTLQASNGNTLRIESTPVATLVIPSGAYAEVVNNSNTTGGTWDLSFTILPKPNNVEIYGTQLSIPPHGYGAGSIADWSNHLVTSYDTNNGADAWWVISKTSTPTAHTSLYSNASRMLIVYEYQGNPFNVADLYPTLTTGNNSSFPDVHVASFVSLANNGTGGKTRLTVSVARLDLIGIF